MSKNRRIKVFAWLLSVVMILNMIPIAAFADDPVDNNVSDPKTEDVAGNDLQIEKGDTPDSGDSSGDSSGDTSGDSPDDSSNGSTGSKSLRYTCEGEPVSMKEGDPDPNKDYLIEVTFTRGTDLPMDFSFDLDYVTITGELPNNQYYKCYIDEAAHTLNFQWKTEERPGFTVAIDCKPAFPEPNGWEYDGKSYAIVAHKTNSMMLPEQSHHEYQSSRSVLKSASCTILNGQVRNNDLEDSTAYWTFTHVSGSWYRISNGNNNVSFDSSNGAILTEEPVALKFIRNYSTQIIVTDGYGKYLTNAKDNPAAGFGNYTDIKGQEMDLYTADQMTRRPTMDMADNMAIVNESMQMVLTTTQSGNNQLNIAAYNLVSDGKVQVKDEGVEAATWEFINVLDNSGNASSDWYYIKSGDKYLNVSQGQITVSDTAKEIFVRHINNKNGVFVLSDSPYINTTYMPKTYGVANLAIYEGTTASANNTYPGGSKNHIYEDGDYKAGYKLRLLPVAGEEDDHLLLTFDYNNGKVQALTEVDGRTVENNSIKTQAGETIVLPNLTTTGNQSKFLGWSTDKNFYAKGTQATTYHELLLPGEPYTMPADSTTLYAVYNNSSAKVMFVIRNGYTDAIIPEEPANHDTAESKHIIENLPRDETIKLARWVIDTNAQGAISATKGGYLINKVTDNLNSRKIPTDAQIKAVFEDYDPDTMYVHWYVIKYVGNEGWHIDGVIRARETVNVSIVGNTGSLVYNGTEQQVEGFDVIIPEGVGLAKTDIRLKDGSSAVAAGTTVNGGTNDNGTYPMGLTADDFENTNTNYRVVIDTVTDGWLAITPRPVTFSAVSETKEYTGETITINGLEVSETAEGTGLVTGDTHNVTFEASGIEASATAYTGTITAKDDVVIRSGEADVTDNYDITVVNGALTIGQTDTVLTVALEGASHDYDGNTYYLTNPATTNAKTGTTKIEYSADGTTWTTELNSLKAKNVKDSKTIQVRATNPNYKNTATNSAQLTINPVTLTITVLDQTYDYTAAAQGEKGTTYTKNLDSKVSVTGLATGDALTSITLNGNATDAEVYPDRIVASAAEVGQATGNYDIEYVAGKLTINKLGNLTVTLKGGEFNYDGGNHNLATAATTNAIGGTTTIEYSKAVEEGETAVWTTDLSSLTAKDVADSTTINVRAMNPNYSNTAVNSATLTINPIALTITALDQSYDYTAAAQGENGTTYTENINSKVSVTGLATGDALTSITLSGNATDAKVYPDWIVASAAEVGQATGNYTIGYVAGKLTINKLGDLTVTLTDGTFDYNGESHNLAAATTNAIGGTTTIEYSADGKTWTTDLNSLAAKNVADSKQIQVRAMNPNYSNTATDSAALTINPIALTITALDQSYDYTGAAQGENGTAYTENIDSKVSVEGLATGDTLTSITLNGSETDANEYAKKIVASAAEVGQATGNYTIGYVAGKLTINKLGDLSVTFRGGEFDYDGESHKLETAATTNAVGGTTTIEYSADGKVWTTDLSSLTATNVADSKTIQVRAMNPNYSNTATDSVTLTIKPVAFTVDNLDNTVYNGLEQKQAPTAKFNDTVLSKGVDYTVEYVADANTGNCKDAGTVTVKVIGKGNFTGTVEKTYQITKRAVTLKSETASKTYDGQTMTRPDVQVISELGFVGDEVTNIKANGEVKDYTEKPVVNSITYTTGDGFNENNYIITLDEGTLSVARKEIYVTADDKTRTNRPGATDPELTASITEMVDGVAKPFTPDATIRYSLSRVGADANPNNIPGDYDIVVSVTDENQGNYHVNVASGTLTIEDATAPLYNIVNITGTGNLIGKGWYRLLKTESGILTRDTLENYLSTVTGDDQKLNTSEYNPVEEYDFSKLVLEGGYVYSDGTNIAELEAAGTPYYTVKAETKNIYASKKIGGSNGSLYDEAKNYAETICYLRKYTITLHPNYKKQILNYFLSVKDTNHQKTNYFRLNIGTFTAPDGLLFNPEYKNLLKDYKNVTIPAYNFSNLKLSFNDKTYTYSDALKTEGVYDDYYTVELIETNRRDYIHGSGKPENTNWFNNPDGWLDNSKADYAAVPIEQNKFKSWHADYQATLHDGNMIKDVVTLTAASDSKKYDGTALTNSGYEVDGLPDGYTVSNVVVEGSAKDVVTDEKLIAKNVITSYKITRNSDGADVTANFVNVTKVAGSLKITPRTVKLTSASDEKEYDGNALTNGNVSETAEGFDGFVTGEGAEYVVTGSQLTKGSSSNTFTYTLKDNTLADNYTITPQAGTLRVTDRTAPYSITVEAKSGTAKYDGEDHKIEGLKTLEFVVEGNKYTVEGLSATVTGKDAGTYYADVVGTEVVKDAAGNDVTAQFNVSRTTGELVISKRTVKLASEGAEKKYDRTALTNGTVKETATGFDGFVSGEGATYTVTGSQTNVGSSDNEFTYMLNANTKAKNYDITTEFGELKVTEYTDPVVVTITEIGGEVMYDGGPHTVTGYDVEISDSLYKVSDYSFTGTASVTETDAGTYGMELKPADFTNNNKNFTNVTFKIEDADLVITPRTVTMTSADDGKVYDRTALTNDTVDETGDGFIEGEGATYTVTGTQTDAGSSLNTFSYELNGNTKAGNYDITTKEGTLTVTAYTNPVVVTITEHSGSEKYDGKEHTVTGYDVEISDKLYKEADFTFSGNNSVSGTDAGTYGMELKQADFTNNNKNFTNVTFKIVDGSLVIGKRAVTMTSADATKVYDRTDLTNATVTESEDGFAEGEGATYKVTGKQTEAGESKNTFSYELNANTKAENYEIKTVEGNLHVKPYTKAVTVTITEHGDKLVYDGDKHPVTGYDVEISDPLYAEGDFSFTGNDKVSGTNAGSYPMELVKDDFANTNINFTDVTFIIVDGKLEITKRPATLTIDAKSKTYGEKDPEFTASFGEGEVVDGDEIKYKLTRTDGENAGTYTITTEISNGNYDVTIVPSALVIDQKAITITADSGSKVYDGIALVKDSYTSDGLVTGDEIDSVTVTGSQKVKGTSDNVPSAAVIRTADGADVTKSYDITYENGTLEVTEKPVTITAASADKVYDAKALTKDSFTYTELAKGDSVTATVTGSQTVAGTSDNVPSAAVIKNAADEDVTESYAITYANGTLEVTPKAVTITADSDTKVYDATALTKNSFIHTALAEGDNVSATVTGSQTEAGESANVPSAAVFTNAAGEDVTASYAPKYVNGLLQVTTNNAVIITAGSATKQYDGTALTSNSWQVAGLAEGDWIDSVTVTGSLYNKGTTDNIPSAAVIRNAAGDDVTASYGITYVNGILEVTAKPITITADSGVKEYDATALTKDTYTNTALAEGDQIESVTLTGSQTVAGKSSNVASAAKIVTMYDEDVTDCYDITYVDGTLEVTRKAVTITAGSAAKVYDATSLGAWEYTNTALAEGDVIAYLNIDGSQYDVGTSESIPYGARIENAAFEDVTASYDISYVNGTLEVTPRPVTITADAIRKTYGDEDPDLSAVVEGAATIRRSGAGIRAEQIDYSLERVKGENANEYSIVVTPGSNPNYDVTVIEGVFTIEKKPVTLTVDDKYKTYGDADPEFTARFAEGDLVGDDEIEYTLTRAAGENVGGYEISTSIDNDNYDVTVVPAYLDIAPKAITLTIDSLSKTYGDADPALTASFGEGDLVGDDEIEYTLVREEGENAGTYKINTSIDKDRYDNYDVTIVPGNLTIDRKAVTLTVAAAAKTYGDKDPEFTASFGEGDLVGEDRIDYILLRAEGEKAGTYTISTIIDDANYDVTVVPAEMTIAKKAVTLTVDAAAKTYGDEDPEFTAGFGEGDLVGGDRIDYTLVRAEGENAGTYEISTSIDSDNYDVTVVPADLTIEKKAVTLTVAAAAKTYGDKDPAFTAGFGEGDLVGEDTISYTLKREAGENAGSYQISTAIDNNNYDVTVVPASLTIAPKAATITVDSKAKTYGDADPALTAKVDGMAGTDAAVYTLNREPGKDVGEYAITAAVQPNPNYTFTVVPGTLTIGPKAVTVTADNKVKTFGEEDPELTVTVTGLVSGDSKDLIAYTVTGAGEEAAVHPIIVTGETTQGNYTVTFVDGEKTVAPADTVIVRIAANNGTYQYDGTEYDLSGYTVTEISNPLYSEADFTFSGNSSLKGTNAGTYRTAMTAADFRNVNDNFSNVVFEVTNGELEITKRTVTMTSGDAAKEYDGTALVNTDIAYGGDGFVYGEEPSVTVTGRQTREGSSENTFLYTLPANASADNYDVTVAYGTLTVTNSNRSHRLIIHYVDENGNELDRPFDRVYAEGATYNVTVPRLTGFTPDTEKIAGTMGGADIEVTVSYSKLTYTLTVELTNILDGTRAGSPITLSLKSGENYTVKIPATEGYTSMVDSVTGIMSAYDRTITVFMIPDGEDADHVRRNYNSMIIEDYGTPLGVFNSVLGSGELAE